MQFDFKNPKWFYDISEVPELKVLEENFQEILNELQLLRKSSENGFWLNTFPDYLHPDSKNLWKVFTFKFFGIKHPLNCSLCPKTFEILEKIPQLISADFSYLPAKTKIQPHKGFTKMVLRAHLGLIVPVNCGLRVGNEIKTWQPGKMVIFDDSFEHEAWNESGEDRFVLMLDIANPRWEYSAKEICRYKIETLRDEFMLSMFPKEKWIEFLNAGEFTAFPSRA
ncbi:MAG: aspartyl/asparaginyl beta-hydroxylase-like dioxygenase [Bacteroidota bacterium]|jgi:beta-hydroxylase|nr:aspartyl/asparaginyl beta-hydroxylase-like dioxygenase [Bacteroidota bacterium]